jgi:hypothetical protein
VNNLTIGNDTRAFLKTLNFPTGDDYSLPSSGNTFESGGHFGIEISSVNNPGILWEIIKLTDKSGITVDRFDECRGIFRLSDNEIKEMVKVCHERQIGLLLSIGPRAIYDIGGFVKSPNGIRLGYRLRGMENVIRAVEDVKRAVQFGVRGFLIYDEGLLLLLNDMRSQGVLPKSTVFKLSVHAGCANPMSARLYINMGIDTINLIPDLELPMLSAMRQMVNCPLDLFTDTAREAGGFLRTYEVPEFIRIAAPIYLKCGPISQDQQNHLPTSEELKERVRQTKCVVETIAKYCPDAKQVSKTEKTLALPEL